MCCQPGKQNSGWTHMYWKHSPEQVFSSGVTVIEISFSFSSLRILWVVYKEPCKKDTSPSPWDGFHSGGWNTCGAHGRWKSAHRNDTISSVWFDHKYIRMFQSASTMIYEKGANIKWQLIKHWIWPWIKQCSPVQKLAILC